MENASIQMTLFDFFMDSDQFTLKEATDAVLRVKEVKEPSVRGRIYEGIDKGLFKRVGKGVYTVRREIDGKENSCLLINGDGRDLSAFSDNSFDALICDHPYKLDKSLKGGNRDFAEYESFVYEQKDLDEKSRVLKPGCFLVEFLPEENADNFQYIYRIKEMAQAAGLEYYATVPWKKGDFVANTGRKAKNTEQIVMFTKGKARSLKIDMKKVGKEIENPVLVSYQNYVPDLGTDGQEPLDYNIYEDGIVANLHLIVSSKNKKRTIEELLNAWENWFSSDYEKSVLKDKYNAEFDIYDTPIENYLCEWLHAVDIPFLDVDSEEFIQKGYYMSGTKGMLPTVFDVEPVSKADRIHQAEKPVELLEEIIGFITMPNEKILDQYMGSGVTGEAALNMKRDSILIEKDKNTYEKAVERINKQGVITRKQLEEKQKSQNAVFRRKGR